jgi:hypothetical protein
MDDLAKIYHLLASEENDLMILNELRNLGYLK